MEKLLAFIGGFITDPKALVALLALILSQLPPIRQLIKGLRLRLAVPDRVQLYHFFGNTNVNLWIDLENVGSVPITVATLRVFLLRRDGHLLQMLRARDYWLTESFGRDKPVALPLGEIPLKAGERWSGYVHCWDGDLYNTAIERQFSALKERTKRDIDTQVAKAPATSPAERPLVEVSQPLFLDLKALVSKLRRIEVGEFDLLLCAYNTAGRPLAAVAFEFTVFDGHVADIFQNVEDYKYGFGVHLPARTEGMAWIDLRPKGGAPLSRAAQLQHTFGPTS